MGYTGSKMGSTASKKRAKDIAVFSLLFSILIFVMAMGYHVIARVEFDRDYEGHLKRAADANSIKMAEKELAHCIRYLDSRGLNSEVGRSQGRIDDYTSIVYSTPDEQISFHYDNIAASQAELQAVDAKGEEATALERSNVLIKLRESLIDHGKEGVQVTYPAGLDVYPNNTVLAVSLIISGVVVVLSACYLKLQD